MDLPRSWHTAQSYEATALGGRKIAGRDLTDGKLDWWDWGAMDGGDDDQPGGQMAGAVSTEIERLGDRPWIIAAGFMKPHDTFVAPKKIFRPLSGGHAAPAPSARRPDTRPATRRAILFGVSAAAPRVFPKSANPHSPNPKARPRSTGPSSRRFTGRR